MSFLLKRKKQRKSALQTVSKGRDFSNPGRLHPYGVVLAGSLRAIVSSAWCVPTRAVSYCPPAMVRKAAWRD